MKRTGQQLMRNTCVNDSDPIIFSSEEAGSHSRLPNLISYCNEDKHLYNRCSQVLLDLVGNSEGLTVIALLPYPVCPTKWP